MENTSDSPLMAALSQFEIAEANLKKLENLWQQLRGLIPDDILFGDNLDYEDGCRSFSYLMEQLPLINGWKPDCTLMNLNDIAQFRLDVKELGEIGPSLELEDAIDKPGKELRQYRFIFNQKRRELIRDTLNDLIDDVDADIRNIRKDLPVDIQSNKPVPGERWESLSEHINQIDTLLGSSVKRPLRWSDLRRHLGFGLVCDFDDIEKMDWPSIRTGLRNGLYGEREPIPIGVSDLAELVKDKPRGPVATELKWESLSDKNFERLIFALICDTEGYENPEWLMHTNAPDRGRDLSVTRILNDSLSGTTRNRVILQCRHCLKKSISVTDIATLREQMKLWEPPSVDVHIIVTSGRFTSDAVSHIERHNQSDNRLRIEMWPESHLEKLLASRPALIAEFCLR